MKIKIFPIVGFKFRPPAEDLLSSLKVGTPLTLIPDPYGRTCDVEHSDPTAVAIFISSFELKALRTKNPEVQAVIDTYEIFHLGYIPKELAKSMHEKEEITSEGILGQFAVSANGKFQVKVEIDTEMEN